MTTYAMIEDGRVLSHFTTNRPVSDFPDIEHLLVVAPGDVQDGWSYLNGVFAPYTPTAEELRIAAIENTIASDTVIASLKAMNNAQFDAWWSANVTTNAQAIAVLKRLARVVIRRVL